ncbi:MAG: DUF3386 family protein [Gemmataceae bacterium]
MKRLIGCLTLFAAIAGSAQAHFIFLLPKPDGRAEAVFSDSLEPDDAKLLAKIKHATFGLVAGDKMVKLTAVPNKDVLAIDDTGKAPAYVQGVCPYGVLDKGKGPFLLTYYCRALVNDTVPRSLATKRTSPAIGTLKLDIVLALEAEGEPKAQVLFDGKPLAGADVVLYAPGGKGTSEVKADANGFVKLEPAKENGLYGVRANHVAKKKGKRGDKEYDEERSYCTLTFLVSDVRKTAAESPPKEDPAATTLLADARAARASWSDLPGFTADVAVNAEGAVTRGTLSVDAKGKVALKLDGDEAAWARATLSSLVGHRMDDAATLTTPCAFADGVAGHPLGRSIKVLNDEWHSSYRVRDRQVIVVNRAMGDSRFTITVLENRLNAEKKYLPGSYVVNSWDKATGALKKSVTHHNTWTRVGPFDLPDLVTVVTAEDGRQVTRTIKVSGHKLATAGAE